MAAQTSAVGTPVIEREHVWVARPLTSEGATWDERDCPVCGLHDQSLRSDWKFGDNGSQFVPRTQSSWQVRTPCIEPVPDILAFEALLADLAAHGARHNPYAMGNPREWRVGFWWAQWDTQGTKLLPAIRIVPPQGLEEGWAQLLRWMRARQYLPERYLRYQSTTPTELILSHGRNPGDEDD